MFEHRAVLLEEAIQALSIKPDGFYVDCTFGCGGHSRSILERLGQSGRLIALDRDWCAVKNGQLIKDPRFFIFHRRFSEFPSCLLEAKVDKVDGVLMDLGVSLHQLKEAGRGFSFLADGPLDMRMDVSCGMTAANWIAQATERELVKVLLGYGQERFASAIARAVISCRRRRPIESTKFLSDLVVSVVRRCVGRYFKGRHPATKTFQAIRIQVNQEVEELLFALEQIPSKLKVGGRLVVISFHSVEDRLVKQTMNFLSNVPFLIPSISPASEKNRFPLYRSFPKRMPGCEELKKNPSARSARLRTIERIS